MMTVDQYPILQSSIFVSVFSKKDLTLPTNLGIGKAPEKQRANSQIELIDATSCVLLQKQEMLQMAQMG
jgi:hypothetical protein